MTIDPQVKVSLLIFGTIIIGIFAWRFSNSIFSFHNKSNPNKFNNSEYRKKWLDARMEEIGRASCRERV